jgi:hypothetical protein
MQDSIITECPLEANLCYYFEFDRSITRYESQPLGYYYRFEGERHLYTPDFEATHGKHSFYYEVNSKIELEKFDGFDPWFNAVQAQAKRLGKDLFLKKKQWVRRSPQFQNIQQCYRCLKVDYSYDFVCRVKSQLAVNQTLPISSLIQSHTELPWVYKLIAEQIVQLSPQEQLLSLDCTVLWCVNEQNS